MRTIQDIEETAQKPIEEVLVEIKLGIEGFRHFCEWVIGETDGKPLVLQDYQLEWANAFLNRRRSCIVAPRGHGKSLILGTLFPLWVVWNQHGKHIAIVSNSMNQSTRLLADMRKHIFSNELLIELKPATKELMWTKTEINTENMCRIICKPFSDNIRGEQIDYCLCDEASLFQEQDIFDSAVVSTTNSKKGHIMVIGTPMTKVDLLSKLSENHEYWYKKYPAIKEDGTPLWPNRFTNSELERIRSTQGSLTFTREYLCEVVDEGTQVIPPSLIAASLDNKCVLTQLYDQSREYFIGIDLAASKETWGDETCFTVVSRPINGPTNQYTIEWINHYRGTGAGIGYSAPLNDTIQLNRQYHPKNILIDPSLYGKPFIDDLQCRGVPCLGLPFKTENRNLILSNLIRLFDNKGEDNNPNPLITLPYNLHDKYTEVNIDTLMRQLSELVMDRTRTGQSTYKTVGKHDDLVMSLALACYAAQESRPYLSYIRTGNPDKIKEKNIIKQKELIKTNRFQINLK